MGSAKSRIVAVVAAGFFGIACGGGNGNPTAPSASTPAAPTVRSLSLSNSSLALVAGNSATVSATAIYSDGSSRLVTPTWSSSNSSIASVDQSGVVRGIGAGVVTITAAFSGASATLSARSIPNYSGRWSGQYRFVSCSAPPRWGSSYCSGLIGTLFNMELNLGQTSSELTGSIRMGSFVGNVTGSIAEDGTISLRGRYTATANTGLVYIFDIRSWQTRSTNGTSMTGRWDSIGSLSGETQTGFEEYEMISVVR